MTLPGHESCRYVLKSKKAFCKFPRAPNSQYCHHHREDRIACPVDGSHSVDNNSVWKHMKKCNYIQVSARDCLQPFFTEDYALGGPFVLFEEQMAEAIKLNESIKDNKPTKAEVDEIVTVIQPARLSKPDWNSAEDPDSALSNHGNILSHIDWSETLVLPAVETCLKPLLEEGSRLASLDPSATEGTLFLEGNLDVESSALHTVLSLIAGTKNDVADEFTVATLLANPARFKHSIQTLEMCLRLRAFMGVEAFNSALKIGDWLEMGAGKGGLMRAVLGFVAAYEDDDSSARFVLIEKDRRRRVAEKLDEKGKVTDKWASKVLRMHIDIVDFDLLSFVLRQVESQEQQLSIPWPLRLHVALYGVERTGLNKKSDMESALYAMAGAGRPDSHARIQIDAMRGAARTVQDDCLDNRPVIIIAKHLCGYGTTLALKSTLRLIKSLPSRSKRCGRFSVYVFIAPCCYHACVDTDVTEIQTLLRNSSDPSVRELADNIMGVMGWSTGADGQRAAIGRFIKDAVLSTRIRMLADAGASRIVATRYCATSVTKENTLLMAEFIVDQIDQVR